MKSINYAPHKVMGIGIVVAIATVPLCAAASVHQGAVAPLQLHPVIETKMDHQPAIGIGYDSALTPASTILATGLSQRQVSWQPPAFSSFHIDQSIAVAPNSNRRQPHSSNQDSTDWIVLIGILGFSSIIFWRILANQSSGNRSSSNTWFDSSSHDSSSDSSSHSDYGNYNDSSDFSGGSSDGGGDGGDW